MAERNHVVVIGAGVIGLCTALYVARRGFQVTVIEREGFARDGCSFGNAGMIVPSHFIPLAAPGMIAQGLKWMLNPASPFYVKPRLSWQLLDWGIKFWRAATPEKVSRASPLLRDLSLASRSLFEELALEENFGLVKRGLLMLCKCSQTLEEESHLARAANQLGLEAEVLDAAQSAALDPTMTMDIAGAVFFPGDCHLSPRRFIEALHQRLGGLGIKFRTESEVDGWRFEGNEIRDVQLQDGTAVEGEEFVLCAGAWSAGLARELKLRIPLEAGKGYSLTLAQPRQLPKLCSILTEARVAVTPMGESLRFGGTMEIGGLNDAIDPRRVHGIIRSVTDYFPEFTAADFAGVQPWRGLRPCSPDGLPYLGRTEKFRNLTVATGHGMMGLSLAPITGKIVSQLLAGEPSPLDLSQLSPDRYS